jgi:hypothetical protein
MINRRDLDKNGVITHPLPMKSMHVGFTPDQFSFSQKNIVHCDDSILKINNRHELLQYGCPKTAMQRSIISSLTITISPSQHARIQYSSALLPREKPWLSCITMATRSHHYFGVTLWLLVEINVEGSIFGYFTGYKGH